MSMTNAVKAASGKERRGLAQGEVLAYGGRQLNGDKVPQFIAFDVALREVRNVARKSTSAH